MNFLLIGNFGAGNYGDEAILIAFLQKMLAAYKHAVFTVPTADEKASKAFLKPFFADADTQRIQFVRRLPFGARSAFKSLFTWRKLKKAYESVDLGIYCGGGLFSDEESAKTCLMWASYGYLLSRFNKPVLSFGLGIGPLTRKISKSAVKKLLLKMSFVGVRDEMSKQIVDSLADFKSKSFLTEDSVFLLQNLIGNASFDLTYRQAGKLRMTFPNYPKPYIALSLRPWKNCNAILYKKLAQALDEMIKKLGFNLVLIPFSKTPQDDEEILRKIIEHSNNKEHIFLHKWSANLLHILHIIQQAELMLGMRLHSNLLSLILNTPFIMLSYAEKGKSFIREQNIEHCQLDFSKIDDDELYRKISFFLKEIAQNKIELESVRDSCIANAGSSFEILKKYI